MLVDGGGGRGGTYWTKGGFKCVYDFRVEPSHSVNGLGRIAITGPIVRASGWGAKPERFVHTKGVSN